MRVIEKILLCQIQDGLLKQFLKIIDSQKMQIPKSPQHYSIEKGKLRAVQCRSEAKSSSIVAYNHTLRYYPDEYHITAIKQYRKQLDQIRRNYQELRRLYYYLLGYRIEGDDRVPRLSFPLEKNTLCVTEVSQSGQTLKYSSSEVNQAINDIEQNTKKIGRLEQRLTQSIIQYKGENSKIPHFKINKPLWKTKTKTQNDEQFEDQLESVLKQNRVLKDTLQKTRVSFGTQAKQIKYSYEEHIRKLEEILERQRKHTRMLNGVIERMRGELGSKDNFIRNVMKAKNADKNGIEKLLRQLKINTNG